MPRPTPQTQFVRFWSQVATVETGCWEWQGFVGTHGYGDVGNGRLAHRAAWAYATGQEPGGDYEIDHLCRNRKCVRPDHLDLVTASENVRRAWANRLARTDACRNGHPATPENIYVDPTTSTTRCRPCRAMYERIRRQRTEVSV